jgi:DNA adenine methylase
MIKSPLRYPGGKSKVIPQIIQYLPSHFTEYREPFVGGGSLFLYLSQVIPMLRIWINDLNPEVYLFWKYAQSDLPAMIEEIRQIRSSFKDGRSLFQGFTTWQVETESEFDRAVRFFILNRITFSGTVESGGYSEQSFHRRFTASSIDRLVELEDILEDVEITNTDYSEALVREGEDVFIYLDPPYLTATKSKLYGRKGQLHLAFDHKRFADLLKNSPHKWLITYDDCPEIRESFAFANLYSWEMQYGMNNYKQAHAEKGRELVITNYEFESVANFKNFLK